MHYEGNIIRPPSEANSIILQVTVGCSHNRCKFCGTYPGVLFRLKDPEIIAEDIEFAARYCRRQKRIFLADGDVLSLPQRKLVEIFSLIKEKLPWVNRVALYGNAKNIVRKTGQELAELKGLGLSRVYMGLESGNDRVLQAINKGVNAETMIKAGKMIRAAGVFLSVTVLLGVAGRIDSEQHAIDTGVVISEMEPHQVGVLTLMLLPETRLFNDQAAGRFALPDKTGFLHELLLMVKNIKVKHLQFQTNHASNYLPINCRLPRDKEAVIEAIEQAIAGERALKPEHLRAL